jgi:3-isopropylmalate/(R)-2-methylmalate dehydratase large subunit
LKELFVGKTIAEKILSTHCGGDCHKGQYVIAEPDVLMTHDGNRPLSIDVYEELGMKKIFDPSRTILVIDHHTPAPGETNVAMHKKMREFSRKHGTPLHDSEGICHQVLPEKGYVTPGSLVIGTDSHTCTYGALNAFSTGVGSTDFAVAMTYGKLWFRVPETLRIDLTGKLPAGVFSKDVILSLIGRLKANGAMYMAVEFCGDTISALSIESRSAICNMVVEMGAKAGIMPFDNTLDEWLRERVRRDFEPVCADENAAYKEVLDYEVSNIGPQIARPHAVDDVVPVTEVGETKIDQANLASCTNGRLEDLRVAARILKGRKIHSGVRLNVVPASREVLLDALKEGIIQTLVESGANINNPSCKGCSGGAMFGVPADGENVITSSNRNFKGRLGNPKAFIYLASPATVAASALTGRITDCREFLG